MTRNAFVVVWDEDEAIDLAAQLSDAGWVVALEHGNPARAWKRIKEGRPDVVVIDVTRRAAETRELLRWMSARKHTSGIPVVQVGGDGGVPAGEVVAAVSAIAEESP